MLKSVYVIFALNVANMCSVQQTSGKLHPQLDGRIIGGSFTQISAYPWQVSLQRFGNHICGGAIYSERVIVTAAHCIENTPASVLQVRAGSSFHSSGGQLLQVKSYQQHQRFSMETMSHDIALLHLSTPLSYGSSIRPIALPYRSPAQNTTAVVTGWGLTASDGFENSSELKAVEVHIISRSVCGSSQYGYGTMIEDNMICTAADGKDACQGDSGGPLVAENKLVGIISWGHGCALANYPGVYADVAKLKHWITTTAGRFNRTNRRRNSRPVLGWRLVR